MHQTPSENSAGAHVGWEEEEEEEDSYNLCCFSPQFCRVQSVNSNLFFQSNDALR